MTGTPSGETTPTLAQVDVLQPTTPAAEPIADIKSDLNRVLGRIEQTLGPDLDNVITAEQSEDATHLLHELSVGDKPEQHEQQSESPHLSVYFFPGFGGEYRGLQGMAKLKDMPQVDDVHVLNSIISGDKPIPDRFGAIATSLQETLKRHAGGSSPDMQRLVLMANSLGASELAVSLSRLHDMDPQLIAERIKNIDFVLLGASGMQEGASGVLTLLKRTVTLMRTQTGQPLSKIAPSVGAGMESLYTVPFQQPEGQPEQNPSGVFNERLRRIFRNESNVEKMSDTQRVAVETDDIAVRNMSEDDRKKLQAIDTRLAQLTTQWEQADQAAESDSSLPRRLVDKLRRERTRLQISSELKKRYKFTTDSSLKAYTGEYIDQPATPESIANLEGFPTMAVGFSAMAEKKTLLKAVVSADMLRQTQKLLDLGMEPSQIKIMMGEWDVFVTAEDIRDLLPRISREGQAPQVVSLEGATHAGWASQEEPKEVMSALNILYPTESSASGGA